MEPVKAIFMRTAAVCRRNVVAAIALTVLILSCNYAFSQVIPASSVVFTSHSIDEYLITSTEDYLQLESSIKSVADKLHDAYQKYPNLSYEASYNGDQIIGFVVNGVKNSEDGNEIAYYLMQLELMGKVVETIDEKYLPSDSASSRVSKRDAQ